MEMAALSKIIEFSERGSIAKASSGRAISMSLMQDLSLAAVRARR